MLEMPRVHDEARGLATRVAEGRFYIACVGQFKRGKSTLIDALLNDPVLPAGIVPVTAVPTIVRYGGVRGARVRMGPPDHAVAADATWHAIAPDDLALYVSEEHNPENIKGVLGVEVFAPCPLLGSGMCLVDTPGLGSVFEGNTAATRAFVPQIDAAIVVIGADPPLTGDELDLIDDASRHVSTLIFVLNKADRATENEREQATAFAQTVVERRLGRRIDRVFQVSATERLLHVGPPRDWEHFTAALESLVAGSGIQLARESGRRGLSRITAQILAATRDLRAALERPVAENEQRLRAVENVIADGDRAIGDLSALSAAETRRLTQRFAAERAAFFAASLPGAYGALSVRIAATATRFGPTLRRHLLRQAQDVARETVEPWLAAQQQAAEAAYREAMTRFIAHANDLFDRLANSGVPELDHLQSALGDMEAGLRARSVFAFNEVMHIAQPASPFRLVADVVLGQFARRAIERDAHTFLRWLLEVNTARVQNDVTQRVTESQRDLERDLRSLLTEAQARAKRALARATTAQRAGRIAVAEELSRLDEIERELAETSPVGNARHSDDR